MSRLSIPAALSAIRRNGHDESGHPLHPLSAEGWESLRCCLALAAVDASIALISYTPFIARSPWTETGPVFIHADECSGYPRCDQLPEQLRTGPRVLRTYHADGTLDYADITVVADGRGHRTDSPRSPATSGGGHGPRPGPGRPVLHLCGDTTRLTAPDHGWEGRSAGDRFKQEATDVAAPLARGVTGGHRWAGDGIEVTGLHRDRLRTPTVAEVGAPQNAARPRHPVFGRRP